MSLPVHLAVETETLFQLLLRSKDGDSIEVLDEDIIDHTCLTLINWRTSDRVAIYHYLSRLIRKIIKSEGGYVTLDCSFTGSNSSSQGSSNGAGELSIKDSILTSYIHSNELNKSGATKVVIFDGLRAFDMEHFASTLSSKDLLSNIKSINCLDPRALYATIYEFLKEEVAFCVQLELIVIYSRGSFLNKMLKTLFYKKNFAFNIIVITPRIPYRSSDLPPYQQVQLTSQSKGHVKVERFVSEVHQDLEIKGFEVLGWQAGSQGEPRCEQ